MVIPYQTYQLLVVPYHGWVVLSNQPGYLKYPTTMVSAVPRDALANTITWGRSR